MRNIIFYKTTADFDNTGEVLIYRNLLNYLRKYGTVVVDDSSVISPLFLERIELNDQERLSKQSSLSFMAFMLLKSITTMFSNKQVWFVTGVGEHNVSGMKGVAKNIAAFCFLFLLRILGVKTFRIGMSMRFGDYWAGVSERLLSKTICYYYVRDSISLDNCKKVGVKKCQLAPDLSWGGFYGDRNKKTFGHHSVLLSFRDFCESTKDKSTYKSLLTKKLLEIIDFYENNDACERIFLTYQCDSDLAYMQEVFEMRKGEKVQLVKDLITLDNAEKYYGKVDLIFSNRLHVLLLGYKFGAPTVCISDIQAHRKIRGILTDNNLDDVLVDIHCSKHELYERLNDIESSKCEIEKKYRNAELANYNRLSQIFEKAFSVA